MKKFIKIFFALVIVVIVAIVGLITFVDPNEYRGYMMEQVEEKTGYKLDIKGDLRWHIWPQISILVDDINVTAPGAKDTMVKAENMRLDVELMPLFSKQLSVKEVLVKGAVIRLTDETKPAADTHPVDEQTSDKTESTKNDQQDGQNIQDWSFGLEQFDIVDSMFVLQQSDNKDDLLTVKNINVSLTMKADRQVDLVANSTINRNQQDISATVKANADLSQYPKRVAIAVSDLSYQLQGAGFPASGIKGDASAKVSYDFDSKAFSLIDLLASANGSKVEAQATGSLGDKQQDVAIKLKATAEGAIIDGDISGTLGDIPNLIIKVVATNVNVDKLTQAFSPAPQGRSADANGVDKISEQSKDKLAAGLKATKAKSVGGSTHELSFLNDLNATLSLNVNSVVAGGITVSNVIVDAENRQGNVQLKKVSAQLLGGSLSAPGSINTKGKTPFIQLSPKVENINMDTLSKTFDIPQTLSGQLYMSGKVSGSGLDINAIKNAWSAELNTRVDNARLNNLNLKQIIHQAAALGNKDVKTDERYDQYTQVRKLSALVLLQKGSLRLNNITVDSDGLNVAGSGIIALAKMQCDINLNVKVLQGWTGKKDIVDILQSTAIPVRIYGPCANLAYKVDVERIIKDQLKVQADKVVDKYLGIGGKSSSDRKNAVANKILGQLTGKK